MNASPLQLVTDRLNAIAEPVRLRMLRVLEVHELTVGEVANVVQLPQSTVSRHLKHLADTGWLTRRLEGTAAFYRLLQDDQPPECRAVWAALRPGLTEEVTLADDRRRAESVVAERRTDSHSFFSRLGGEWDSVRGELFGSRFTPMSLLALVNPRWRVADIGCGTGNVAEVLCPWAERVIGIDASPEMLRTAKSQFRRVPNAEFREGGAEDLPLPDHSVDVVTCVLVLHHAASPQSCLREMVRVLTTERGGGMAVIVDMVPHTREEYRRTMGHKHLGFGEQALCEMMRAEGFSTVRWHELPPERGTRGPGLFVALGTVVVSESEGSASKSRNR